MKKIVLITALVLSCKGLAQVQVTVKAFIFDYVTGEPIPYANVGFIEKGVGTVSDENGAFTLVYDDDEIGFADQLQISVLGYKTENVKPDRFEKFLTNTNKIYLKPQPEILEEVLITNERTKKVYLGDPKIDRSAMGYWKDVNALGGEISTLVKAPSEKTRLKNLSFTVVENQSDSLKVRVNIYDYSGGFPGKKIPSQNIYHTVKNSDSLVVIDLEPYNVRVDRDFVVGIELIKVYGDIIEFAISGKFNRGRSFKRYVSQDRWIRNTKIGINFGLEATVPVLEDEKVLIERERPTRITVYWDNSTVEPERDIRKELNFLKAYLKELNTVEVEVVRFNSHLERSEPFSIRNGDFRGVIDYLSESQYYGAVDYSGILQTNDFNADAALLFSDGNTIFSPLEPVVYIPVFGVNSSANADHYQMQRAALYSDGHYLNLDEISIREALQYALNEIEDKVSYDPDLRGDQILGKVFTASGPIQGATVRLKNTFDEVQSNVDGFFEINATEGDILVASFLGMKTREVRVINPESVAILLQPDGELLQEVDLKGERLGKDLVETPIGKQEKRSLGFSSRMISGEDIGPQYTTLADAIRGEFPGIQVVGLTVAGTLPRFILRQGIASQRARFAMLDIDGMIFSSDQVVPFIDPQNIESISILQSIIATTRYGQLGRGGAIVVRTKTSGYSAEEEPSESGLVSWNDYVEEGVLLLKNSPGIKPGYIKLLEKATSFDEARNIYDRLKQTEGNQTIPFYMDVSDYFMRWNHEFSYSVLTTIGHIAKNNPKALKTLAFKMEELNQIEDAKYVYEQLLNLRPKQEQTYRDLARIYVANEEYTKAMNLYKKILAKKIDDVEFVGLGGTIENEIMNLLAFHRSKVKYRDLPIVLRSAKFKYDYRLVFEWNDPNAEFEIQFVNPKKKYFTWSHSKFNNKDRMLDEVKYGYNTEEFIIDDGDPGEWIINIRSLGNEDQSNPSYLKYTVYKNYALPDQTSSTKLVKLYKHNTKVTLDSFRYEQKKSLD